MKKSTKQTDAIIVKSFIEFLKGKKNLIRKDMKQFLVNKSESLKVDASYIIEKIECKFDYFVKVAEL